MSTKVIEGFLATSDPLKAYGGIALAPKAIYDIAQSIRDGKMSLRAHHNESYLFNHRIIDVDVRETKKGSLGVWAQLEIDEQEWEELKDLKGFSIAVVSDFFEPDPTDNKPAIKIYTDAGHYSEEDFGATIEELEKHFAVGGGRLYQFNILPPAKIIIDFAQNTLQAIPPNLISSWLYDALKSLLLHLKLSKLKNQTTEQKPTAVTVLRVTSEDQQVDLFQIQTNDPTVLQSALDTFYSNLSSKSQENGSSPKPQESFHEFDNDSKKWKKLR